MYRLRRRQLSVVLASSMAALIAVAGSPGTAYAQPPANDDFTDAVVLTGLTANVSGTTQEATGETGEPQHAGDPGPVESVWYSWTAPFSTEMRFDTCTNTSINFNTLLAVYTGASVNALTSVASNDNHPDCGFAGNSLGSLVTFNAVAGTTYRIAVDGQGSNDGTFILNIEPTAGAGTLNLRKSFCTDISTSTLTEAAFVARAACVAGNATFQIVTDPPTGAGTVVATVQTDAGVATIQLVAGNFEVSETSPAVVGPEPITLAADGSVTVVAENPQGLAPTPTPTPTPAMLPDARTTDPATQAEGSGLGIVAIALAVLLAAALNASRAWRRRL